NFHAEHILYEANIRLRLRGQVPEPSYAGSLLLPTRKLFIYRLSGGERGAGGRHRIGLFAMNTVSGADLDGWQRIQYVEARKNSGGKAVDADAVARGDTVEPAAATRAARSGAILGFGASFAQQAAGLVEQFGGHRAVADARVIGLENAEDRLDLRGADAHADGSTGSQRGWDRRRDVFVGPGVEVQQRALCALEKNSIAGLQRLMDERRRIGNVGRESGAEIAVLVCNAFHFQRVRAVGRLQTAGLRGDAKREQSAESCG